MEKNEPLGYRDYMLRIEKRVPEREIYPVLSMDKQRIFIELHNLSGKAYQDKIKELINGIV